jgi:hypothetical protein
LTNEERSAADSNVLRQVGGENAGLEKAANSKLKQIHQKDGMLKNSLLSSQNGKWWEIKGPTTVIQADINFLSFYLHFFFKN